MNNKKKQYSAGDIIQYENGKHDYLVLLNEGGELGVNATNPAWIESGRSFFCRECYPFDPEAFDVKPVVIGHYGTGIFNDAQKWYEENKENI